MSKTKPEKGKPMPLLDSDEAAEAFVAAADLSARIRRLFLYRSITDSASR